MIKAVIFDVGGVMHNWPSFVKEIALAYGISQEELSSHMDPILEFFRKGQIDEEEFWKKLSLSLKKPVPENKDNLWHSNYEKTFVLYSQVMDLVKEVKERGIKTAMLSNIIPPHLEVIKKHIDFKLFDATIFSCEVGLSKSSSAIYFLTAEKLDTKPEECLFIDDQEKRLLFAKELGMKTILAKNPNQVVRDTLLALD